MSQSTSPGSGWRLSRSLEKSTVPSTETSKAPPDDSISRMAASG